MEKRLITLFASSLGIINHYTIYPRILFPIGIFALRFSFGRIFLNLLVLSLV